MYRRIQELKLGARSSAEGASPVQAPNAPRGVVREEGVSPSPQEKETRKGALPSAQKFFSNFRVKMAYFCGFC